MSPNQNYRLQAAVIDADREALLALKDLADYQPVNPAHSVEALTALSEKLRLAEEADLRVQKAQVAAREALIEFGWEFHNAMLGVKAQVTAQFGSNSLAVQALGLKKKSDRKRPVRRPPATTPS
ncbi:MAG: hypothetical protein IPO81_18405 [Kouleothrix sp.]|nr:hypothetical protein [Kouleothrix sp.]